MSRWVWLFFLSFPALARVNILSSKMPLVFERNEGQSAVEYKFVAVGPDHALLLSPTGAVVRHAGARVRIHWRGSKRRAAIAGLEPQTGKINYIVGNRRSGWRTDIRTYSKVRYQGIYPGVDLVFHGSRGELEFDFVVAPGANPEVIRLGFDGASRMEIDAAGDLVLADANLRLRKPLIYQEGTPSRRTLEGGYSALSQQEVGFRITSYDKSQPLVIDPVLSFSTYLGGTSSENVTASGDLKSAGIATDPQGNVYITGSTSSTDFPSGGKIGSVEAGSADLFVSKFSSTGEMIYTTRIGGSSLERGFGIAVDSSGNAYLTGRTQSTDFPLVNAAQATFGGIEDAYVLKLNPAGNQLLYSTFLGGNDTDFACGIATDASGNAYVTGDSESYNFPVTSGAFQRQHGGGTSDAFVAKFGPSGSLAYASYLGGRDFDHGESVAVDGNGNAYVTGFTPSPNFPAANPLQSALKGPLDVFVTKLNATGTGLIYSTYLGGTGAEAGVFVSVDASGNAYVAGATQSTDFPVTQGAVQTTFKGEQDGFLAKINTEGSAMVFSTYLGGGKADSAVGVAVDGSGNSYVVGSTRSPEFPTVNAFQATHAGNDEVFITKINAAGSALVHSSFLGGSGWDLGYAIVLDNSGNIFVTGRTDSTDFPTLKAHQSTNKGNRDAFLARIAETALAAFVTVSSASYEGGVAPDSFASGFGEKLSAGVEVATTIPLPTVLGGVSVKVKDVAGTELLAPLVYVSPGQINYLIPAASKPGPATVTVLNQNTPIAAGTAGIARIWPALFSMNGDGKGVAAAMGVRVAANGKQIDFPVFVCGSAPGSCVTNPIDLSAANEQVILLLFGTGIRGRTALDQVKVEIGGFQGEVQYAGAQLEYPGLDQVNVKMPSMPNVRGRQALWLTVEGQTANMVEVEIK
jgi:uncharacterized protein (TIGR03437 family)